MNILVNASNLKKGGGIQVAKSIFNLLGNFNEHHFIVVHSPYLGNISHFMEWSDNVDVYEYTLPHNFQTLFFGRDKFLDSLVVNKNIDCVLTIFGPSIWTPKCKHVSGFARAHIVMPDSPYFKKMGFGEKIKSWISNFLLILMFKRNSKIYYTENQDISQRLKKKLKDVSVYTVTNYYNQIFDLKDKWIHKQLSSFNGITLLTISAAYPHKNLEIASNISVYLRENYPGFKFRFVFSIDENEYDNHLDKQNIEFIGNVSISECPSLYTQADIVFQPTLLECFTATYVEAMKMEVPIITTDLGFARGICDDAAVYYSSTSYQDAAESIITLSNNSQLRAKLIRNGKARLRTFDDYHQRVSKIIKICTHCCR
ncbi:MAG: glycosyltransferase [Bacteroidales bacterium]|nr:glycosyltransferase [Bacteroidales bacterium]